MQAYQLTKTIRFKLEQDTNIENALINEKLKSLNETPEDIHNNLLKLYQSAQQLSEILLIGLFKSSYEEKLKFKSKCPEVKYGWLKSYTKQEYYELITNKKQKSYKLNRP